MARTHTIRPGHLARHRRTSTPLGATLPTNTRRSATALVAAHTLQCRIRRISTLLGATLPTNTRRSATVEDRTLQCRIRRTSTLLGATLPTNTRVQLRVQPVALLAHFSSSRREVVLRCL